jgi:hypothetical protein
METCTYDACCTSQSRSRSRGIYFSNVFYLETCLLYSYIAYVIILCQVQCVNVTCGIHKRHKTNTSCMHEGRQACIVGFTTFQNRDKSAPSQIRICTTVSQGACMQIYVACTPRSFEINKLDFIWIHIYALPLCLWACNSHLLEEKFAHHLGYISVFLQRSLIQCTQMISFFFREIWRIIWIYIRAFTETYCCVWVRVHLVSN